MIGKDETINLSNLLKNSSTEEHKYQAPLLTLRLFTLMIMAALLTIHLRSLRVFRWELSVSGGLIIAYSIATLGLALCAGSRHCGAQALQAYLSATGAVLLSVNAAVLWQRWRQAGEITRVVAELLMVMGVPLKRQVFTKVILSVVAAIAFLIDLLVAQFLTS